MSILPTTESHKPFLRAGYTDGKLTTTTTEKQCILGSQVIQRARKEVIITLATLTAPALAALLDFKHS